jgi:hypothetical protein
VDCEKKGAVPGGWLLPAGKKTVDKGSDMKKRYQPDADDESIIELMRILIDEDAEGALAFLKQHFKGKARELLEGG